MKRSASNSRSLARLALAALASGCSSPILSADAGPMLDVSTMPDVPTTADAPAFDTAPPSDAGLAPLDVGAADAPADAGPRTCDPRAPFGAPTLVAGLDSTATDADATLSSDELIVVFASARAPSTGVDLWTASRADRGDAFSSVRRIDTLVTVDVQTQPWLSPDGLTLYYRTDTATDTEIVASTRATRAVDFPLGAPVAVISSSALEVAPFLTGTALYFGRLPLAGGEARELWRARRLGGSFDVPALVSELNTTAEESDPVLGADELTIYFSSDRAGGGAMGAADIWRATRATASGAFTSIENVAELNTAESEWPDHLSEDGCRLYLTTTMGGDYGLYVAQRTP